jgi:glucose-1-phosphate thymidylyltransferase
MNLPYGTPFTLDQAYPFIKNKNVAMGFPDIIMEPVEAFSILKKKLLEANADVVLGLFPIEYYWKWDMIEFDGTNINEIIIKGKRSDLKYGWSNAVWQPAFTEFMHQYLKAFVKKNPDGKKIQKDGSQREVYVGDVFMEAIQDGLKIDYVIFDTGFTNDIGTHEEMAAYLQRSMKK